MSSSSPLKLSTRQARSLALVNAGLIGQTLTGLPKRAAGANRRTRGAVQRVIEQFGYLQLDTVAVTGARTQSIVLASRLAEFPTKVGEELLKPKEPLFEYWGHEASWLPMDLYPAFGFRRIEYKTHPWWGDLLTEHRALANQLVRQIEVDGPVRSLDLEGKSVSGWWDTKLTKRIAEALWSAGELAIRERKNFQRSYDLVERVIPQETLNRECTTEEAIELLLLKALDGHGWATTGTLAATWRLSNKRPQITGALDRLVESGQVVPCVLSTKSRDFDGWIRTRDAERIDAADKLRPRTDNGVLLSPFDPVLWDRKRVSQLFDFEQVLEIYKPKVQRVHGYYAMPILAGTRLIGRVDLKADTTARTLAIRYLNFERTDRGGSPSARDAAAARSAIERFARSVELEPVNWPDALA